MKNRRIIGEREVGGSFHKAFADTKAPMGAMGEKHYQQIGFTGIRRADGSLMLNVPLYIEVAELNKNGVTDSQEEVIHRLSETILEHYEKQVGAYFAEIKAKKQAQ